MPPRTLVIVNPASRAGATRRGWPRLEPRLADAIGAFDTCFTGGTRDAIRIAAEGAARGFERLLVAGGDGTASEVVTGLLGAGLGERSEIGFLPLGSGGDLLRSLGIPRDLGLALAMLRKENRRRIDAGRVRWVGEDGARCTSWFVNAASAGVSGLVTRLVTTNTKRLGANGAFLLGTIEGVARYRPAPTRVAVDGEVVFEGPLVLATASNGRYFGSGMRIAPDAELDDGKLDFVIIPDMPKLSLLARLPQLYSGAHTRVRGVQTLRGQRLEIEPLGDPLRMEADGESLGSIPVEAEIVPGALQIVGVPS